MTSAEQRGFEPNRSASKRLVQKQNTEILKQNSGQIGKKISKRNSCNLSKQKETKLKLSLRVNWRLEAEAEIHQWLGRFQEEPLLSHLEETND